MHIFIKCDPPKATGNNTKACGIVRGHARIFDSSKSKSVKKMMYNLLLPYAPKIPLTGPLEQSLVFIFPYNKSDISSKAKRAALEVNGYVWHDTKPDLDNLRKILNDTLEKLGFFHNDSQIVIDHGEKLRGSLTGIHIMLSEITRNPKNQIDGGII